MFCGVMVEDVVSNWVSSSGDGEVLVSVIQEIRYRCERPLDGHPR